MVYFIKTFASEEAVITAGHGRPRAPQEGPRCGSAPRARRTRRRTCTRRPVLGRPGGPPTTAQATTQPRRPSAEGQTDKTATRSQVDGSARGEGRPDPRCHLENTELSEGSQTVTCCTIPLAWKSRARGQGRGDASCARGSLRGDQSVWERGEDDGHTAPRRC